MKSRKTRNGVMVALCGALSLVATALADMPEIRFAGQAPFKDGKRGPLTSLQSLASLVARNAPPHFFLLTSHFFLLTSHEPRIYGIIDGTQHVHTQTSVSGAPVRAPKMEVSA